MGFQAPALELGRGCYNIYDGFSVWATSVEQSWVSKGLGNVGGAQVCSVYLSLG